LGAEELDLLCVLVVPFRDDRDPGARAVVELVVDDLAEQVTVPEGGEVGGRDLGGDQLALGGAQGADRGDPLGVEAAVPARGAGDRRVGVVQASAGGVPRRRAGPQPPSRGGVAGGGAPFPAGVHVLVGGEDLETRAGGVDVADVHRVPVTQPGRVQAGAVVV